MLIVHFETRPQSRIEIKKAKKQKKQIQNYLNYVQK